MLAIKGYVPPGSRTFHKKKSDEMKFFLVAAESKLSQQNSIGTPQVVSVERGLP